MRYNELIDEAMAAAKRSGCGKNYALGYLAVKLANLEEKAEELKRNNGMTNPELDVMLCNLAEEALSTQDRVLSMTTLEVQPDTD